jgi:hypothetical protein
MRIEGGEGIRTLINSLSAKYLVSAGERIAALPPHRKIATGPILILIVVIIYF